MKIRFSTGRIVIAFVAALIVPLSASAQEVLTITPATISVQATEGTTPPSQTLDISNEGNRAMKWWIDPPTASWLVVSPTSGVQDDRVTVSFASGLPAGAHSASFTVRTDDSSAATVSVLVTIAAGTPCALAGALARRHHRPPHRRPALRNMSGKHDRAVVEWFRGGGDLQCDH